MVKRYQYWSIKIQNSIASGLLLLLTAVVFLQVLARKIIPFPIPWTEEVAKLSLLWITYLGLAATFNQNYHIRVDLLDGLLKTKIRKNFMNLLIQLMGIFFGCIVSYYAYAYFQDQLTFGQHTTILSIPMWIVTLPLLVGGALTVINFCIEFLTILKEMRNDK